MLADPEYTWSEAQQIGGYRAALGVPLLRDGKVVGVIFVAKDEPQPFTPRQIELVTTFADQAVIALENVRLFEEVQSRTREIQEALEYQTATGEVLNVISRSPSQVQPVLDTIVETATRLCSADFGYVFRLQDDGRFHLVASDDRQPRFTEFLAQHPILPGDGSLTGRVAIEKRTLHIPDAQTDPSYRWTEWLELTGFHTFLSVPLMKDGEVSGVIALARKKTSPFSEKQTNLERFGVARNREL